MICLNHQQTSSTFTQIQKFLALPPQISSRHQRSVLNYQLPLMSQFIVGQSINFPQKLNLLDFCIRTTAYLLGITAISKGSLSLSPQTTASIDFQSPYLPSNININI